MLWLVECFKVMPSPPRPLARPTLPGEGDFRSTPSRLREGSYQSSASFCIRRLFMNALVGGVF